MSWYDEMVAAGRSKSLTTGNIRCEVAAVHEVLGSPALETPVNCHSEPMEDLLRNIELVQLGVKQMCVCRWHFEMMQLPVWHATQLPWSGQLFSKFTVLVIRARRVAALEHRLVELIASTVCCVHPKCLYHFASTDC